MALLTDSIDTTALFSRVDLQHAGRAGQRVIFQRQRVFSPRFAAAGTLSHGI